jgi:hypothetical protein
MREKKAMAGILEHTCKACGEHHVLFLATADMAGGLDPRGEHKRYKYTCPTTKLVVRCVADDLGVWKANVTARPRDAVELRDDTGA